MTSLLSRFSSKQYEATGSAALPTNFVAWPDGDKGHLLQDIEISLPVQEVLHALFGRQAAVGEICRKKQGSHDYVETEWLPSEDDARLAFSSVSVAHEEGGNAFPGPGSVQSKSASNGSIAVEDSIQAGYCRMNMSNSTHLGRTAYNIEREICKRGQTKEAYDIDVCVCSTAAMADRFRCVFRHKLRRIDDSRSRWTAQYTIIFVEKTTFLLRKPIETGAQGAIKSNFNLLAEVLKQYATGKLET